MNLVPVRHNSPCQNTEANHDSQPWSPTLLHSNKPTDMRSFFYSVYLLAFIECDCIVGLNKFTRAVKKWDVFSIRLALSLCAR